MNENGVPTNQSGKWVKGKLRTIRNITKNYNEYLSKGCPDRKTLKNFKSVEFEPLKLKEDNLDEWVALTLTPDPLHINLLGGANDCIEKCESMYPIEMKSYFKRHCLNKAGEGPGGKFNGPSIIKSSCEFG